MYFNYYGVTIGLAMLIATGAGHIIVIKGQYHFGIKLLPVFLIIGILCLLLSIICKSALVSGILGIVAITFLWGILEIIKQKKRVEKGWFPKKD